MVIKNKFSIICIIFTITTLLSNVLNLIEGNNVDTPLHILFRFLFCLIGVGSMFIFDLLNNKSVYLSMIVHYFCSLGLVFILTWSSQLVEPLSKNAYRDVYFNYTALYLAFVLIRSIIEIKNRKSKKLNM